MKSAKGGMQAGRPSRAKTTPALSAMAEKPDTVRVNFDLDRAAHTKLKVYAAQTGRSMTDILRELINSIDDLSK